MLTVSPVLPLVVAMVVSPGYNGRQEPRWTSSRSCPAEVISMPHPTVRLAGAASDAMTDSDGDGISDEEERLLLDTYRPYLRFSSDYDGGGLREEAYNPTDVLRYIQQSVLLASGDEGSPPVIANLDLAANPGSLLFEASNVVSSPGLSRYHLDPLETVSGSHANNPGRHGADWAEILARRNVGLYGHVVPYREASPQSDIRRYHLDPTRVYYKVEYWQFFGYNNANTLFGFGDHEGDWASVQVIFDPVARRAVSVLHYAHGIEFRFDLAEATECQAIESDVLEFRGRYDPTVDLVDKRWQRREDQITRAQNNVVRMYRDPTTAAFTHPVVYIEYGSHEFFPTDAWSYHSSPRHDGESRYRYLTEPPPNLGEVEQPMTEVPEAVFILQFNGSWGAFGRRNTPPQGPPLHDNWTWPASSSVRGRIVGRLGF